MKVSALTAMLASALFWPSSGYAACAAKQPQNCAAAQINLDGVALISRQIAAQEAVAQVKKSLAPSDTTTAYTGPTVGVSDRVHRAATVGYRWALH